MPFLLAGCARYDYRVVRPSQEPALIEDGKEMVVRSEPVEYRIRTYADHVVVQAHNAGPAALRLVGTESDVTDPSGFAHPLRDRTLPAGGTFKLILPPTQPDAPAGPSSDNVSVNSGGPWRDGLGQTDPFPPVPRPAPSAPADMSSWNWYGEGRVRLRLTFQPPDGKPFTQTLEVERERK